MKKGTYFWTLFFFAFCHKYREGVEMSSESLFSVLGRLWEEYQARTPQKLKLVDAYLAYIMATGIIQFLYCLLVGTFPFNSFLSGFISCVGSFVLTGEGYSNWSTPNLLLSSIVCLRIQSNPQNKSHFANISPERAFGDFLIASLVLHLVVINFIG